MLFHTLSAWLTLSFVQYTLWFSSIDDLRIYLWSFVFIVVIFETMFLQSPGIVWRSKMKSVHFPYNFAQLFSFVLFQNTTFRPMTSSAFLRCVLFLPSLVHHGAECFGFVLAVNSKEWIFLLTEIYCLQLLIAVIFFF